MAVILAEGQKAPDFSLKDQDGKTVKLSAFKGKKVLLYFYPKADTPGCTTQSCAVRDARQDMKKLKVDVLGISPEPPKTRRSSTSSFPSGSRCSRTPRMQTAEAYGVWGEKTNYGKTYMGIIRSSFLVDETGPSPGSGTR